MFLPKGQSQTGMANAPHCQREGGSGGFSNSGPRPLSFYFARVCLKAAAAGSSFDAQSRPGPVPLLVVSPGKPPTRGGGCRRVWCNSGRPLCAVLHARKIAPRAMARTRRDSPTRTDTREKHTDQQQQPPVDPTDGQESNGLARDAGRTTGTARVARPRKSYESPAQMPWSGSRVRVLDAAPLRLVGPGSLGIRRNGASAAAGTRTPAFAAAGTWRRAAEKHVTEARTRAAEHHRGLGLSSEASAGGTYVLELTHCSTLLVAAVHVALVLGFFVCAVVLRRSPVPRHPGGVRGCPRGEKQHAGGT